MDRPTGPSPDAEYQLETFLKHSALHSETSHPLGDIVVNQSETVPELLEDGTTVLTNSGASVAWTSDDENRDRHQTYSVTGKRASRGDAPKLEVGQSQGGNESSKSSFSIQAVSVQETGEGGPWTMGQAKQELATTPGDAAIFHGDQETHEPAVGNAGVPVRLSIESVKDGRFKENPRTSFEYDPIDSAEAVSAGFAQLNFKPIQLRTWFLVATITFLFACIGSIIAIVEWARIKGGILHVDSTQDYYAFRYAPIVVGSVTTIWWRTIFTTYSRLSPYLSMSAHPNKWNESETNRQRTRRILHAYYADAMFEPNIFHIPTLISNGKWLLTVCTLVSITTMIYLVPLKATFIQVTPGRSGWDIAVSNRIGYTLTSIYAILSIVTLLIIVKLYHRDTGLKWDPVSLADQLALVQGSNFVSLFTGLEACSHRDYRQLLRERAPEVGSLRLGYWKHRQDGTIWHGLAFVSGTSSAREERARHEQGPRRRRRQASLEDRKMAAMPATPKHPHIASVELSAPHEIQERPNPVEDVHDRDLAAIRYRGVDFWLCDISLSIFALVALVALAFVIAGLSNGHLQNGIQLHPANIESPSNSTSNGASRSPVFDSSESFLFRFLPVFLMGIFATLWNNADRYYRYMQPFAGMSIPLPATENILLDYPTYMPIAITFKAATKGHWRVALFSLLALTGTIPPIIAAGIFVGSTDATGVVVRLNPLNFWATFSILIICCFCIGFARPTTAYRLPRCIWNIANLMLFCNQSRILDDEILEKPVFSANDPLEERIHMESRIHLAKQKYVFGLYLGKDGKRHLGFDVAERQGPLGQVESVEIVRPGRGLYLAPGGWTVYFRRPQIVRQVD